MNENIKPFGWKRNWEYFKINLWLMMKGFVEYKAELYNYLLRIPISLSVTFFSLFIINREFNVILNWTIIEYGYFMVLFEIINRFTFWTLKPLHRYILNGELNKYLLRPLNVFFQHTFESLDPYELMNIGINLVIFGILLFLDKNLNFLNVNFIVFFVSIIILQSLFWILFESIAFVMIGVKKAIDVQLFEINSVLEQFPTQFFSNSKLRYFIMIFPSAFISITLINVLKGGTINFMYYNIMLLMFIIISFLIFINWHYGLKKYEAFG